MGKVLVVDSSGLLAALDAGEPDRARVMRLLETDERPLVTTDFVLAEVDYLILTRLGSRAERAFIAQVLEGIFVREMVTHEDIRHAEQIMIRYQEHKLGLTDATLMALCERLQAHDVLTLDHRHFSLFRNSHGRSLQLLPEKT